MHVHAGFFTIQSSTFVFIDAQLLVFNCPRR